MCMSMYKFEIPGNLCGFWFLECWFFGVDLNSFVDFATTGNTPSGWGGNSSVVVLDDGVYIVDIQRSDVT